MRPKLLALVALLMAAACLAGAPAAEQTPWRVGTWKTAQTIQPFFYHRYLGIQPVEVAAFTNPADQKMALLAGSLDMCGTTLAHAIHAASRGEPVVVVAALCNKCSALVVDADGPVRSVGDLAGKKIGYVPGTMHEILLRETLTAKGLNPDRDVELVRVDFFDMGLALAQGGIDAFLSGEPFPALAQAEGYGRILAHPYYGQGIGTINAAMLVRRKTVANQPEKVMALVKAHARATQWLTRHPDKWLEAAAGFGTPRKVLEKAAPNMELAWGMDRRFVERVAALGARMRELGMIEREPDYSRLVDLRFVSRVRMPR